MRRVLIALPLTLALASLAGCGAAEQASADVEAHQAPAGATEIPMQAAQTFRVFERDDYRIVDMRAAIVNWGGEAVGQEQFDRLVLVPKGVPAPDLTGDLADATLIRTPVMAIASNTGFHEAITKVLGINDRIVAIGGAKSYDDDVRNRALSGKIRQIGYGWHSPPHIDALIASQPDVLLMSIGDLANAGAKSRIEDLGIPVVPIFLENEPDYMGRVDYVRLIGMLTGREKQADAFAAMVADNVDAIRSQAASYPTRTLISAWFAGGDSWKPTVRNADAKLLRDANGRNLLEMPDDRQKDSFTEISTEEMIARGAEADCWIMRDSHSAPFTQVSTLRRFKAYREGCIFAADGMVKAHVDAFDYYEMAVIRPDWLLRDLAMMLHPQMRDTPFRYIRPDREMAR